MNVVNGVARACLQVGRDHENALKRALSFLVEDSVSRPLK